MFFRNWYWLYSGQTAAELALEPEIAAMGVRYRAQHPFPGLKHVADFALLDSKLIIEVDGASHEKETQKAKDAAHTLGLHLRGWRVLRCKNEEVVANPKGTLRRLLSITHFPTREALEEEVRKHPLPPARVSKRRVRVPKQHRVSRVGKRGKAAAPQAGR